MADLKTYQSNQGLSDGELLLIGDVDNDGALTNADLQALLAKLQSGSGSTTPVPEPTSLLLLVTGIVALIAIASRSTVRRSIDAA
jgi:PEP-CTERM motif